MIVLGIDPGASGGLALVGDMLWAVPMPATLMDVWQEMKTFQKDVSKAVIEKVGPMRGWGGSSSFSFGRNYGNLEAFLTASGIPFEYVAPTVWQKALGCMTKGDKNVTKAKAQQLYPSVKWTHATADAALIATFGLRST